MYGTNEWNLEQFRKVSGISAEMSCVCVLRPVSVFCVLRYVRRKYNVRRHGQHGIY